jgi:hypothetical protein
LKTKTLPQTEVSVPDAPNPEPDFLLTQTQGIDLDIKRKTKIYIKRPLPQHLEGAVGQPR